MTRESNDTSRQAVAARLRSTFQTIWRDRMSDVPIVNPALEVAVIGLQRWNGHWLAILVTPWCMNIMILPGSLPEAAQVTANWPRGSNGDIVRHGLPCGSFSFILGDEPDLGPFQMCSIFSPMLGFADQAAAIATAEAAMQELMTPPVPTKSADLSTPSVASRSRRELIGMRSVAGQTVTREAKG